LNCKTETTLHETVDQSEDYMADPVGHSSDALSPDWLNEKTGLKRFVA
jgi:hypothetical protein